jgi:predicted MFS family arabinose efflux permease
VIITLVMARLGIREHVGDRTRRVDVGGAVLAMTSLAAVCYGLIEGPAHHWDVVTVATIIGGFALMYGFVAYEKRVKDPMIRINLFASANFTAANITTFAMYGALGGFFFALTIYLQSRAGYSAFMAGASLLPVTVVMFLLSARVGRWSAKLGPRRFMTAGPIVAAAGIGLLGFIGSDAPYVTAVLPGVLLFSIGLALTVAPLTSTVMGSVGPSDSGIASGVNNAVSRVAGLLVIALLGLFGSAHVYVFAASLCAALALGAGVVSWVMVRDDDLIQSA